MNNALPATSPPTVSAALRILGTSAVLCLFLLVARARVLGVTWRSLRVLPDLLAAGYDDFLFVAIVTLVFLVALRLARRGPLAQRVLAWLYSLVAVTILVAAILNIQVLRVLGRPFTYQWLYYSDFLRSLDAQRAIQAGVSWTGAALLALVAAGLLGGGWLAGRGLARLQRRVGDRFFLGVGLVAVLYFPLARWERQRGPWSGPKLVNPLVAFVHSFLVQRPAALFTMATPVGPADFAIASERAVPDPPAPGATPSPIRNVLVFVLESVPAEYLAVYGCRYAVTPELSRYRGQAMFYRRLYATAPATNLSIVSLLCAVYPWISFQSITQACPDADLPSLVSELKQRGYRTGFFSSSDMTYQGAGRFLAARQFEVVADFHTLPCQKTKFVDPSGNRFFLDGVDDECAVDALIDWLRAGGDRPFLGMAWTMMTHYPYFVSEPETDYGVGDEFFNRYLNALRHGDRCFGKVMRALEELHLADSTLVVVVGDHGEAFGRHQQWTHATKIYEENVQIPLLLINRQLFHGEESAVLGSMIDIAPTVLDLMHLPGSPRWQGRSLASADRSPRVYFFATWSEFLFGYRDERYKYIYNASTSQYEIYDLERDPLETTSLVGQQPALVPPIAQHLAAWVQYQDKLMQRAMANRAAGR